MSINLEFNFALKILFALPEGKTKHDLGMLVSASTEDSGPCRSCGSYVAHLNSCPFRQPTVTGNLVRFKHTLQGLKVTARLAREERRARRKAK